jgi:hypothetical protein
MVAFISFIQESLLMRYYMLISLVLTGMALTPVSAPAEFSFLTTPGNPTDGAGSAPAGGTIPVVLANAPANPLFSSFGQGPSSSTQTPTAVSAAGPVTFPSAAVTSTNVPPMAILAGGTPSNGILHAKDGDKNGDDGGDGDDGPKVPHAPEPGSFVLWAICGIGAAGLTAVSRRRRTN